MLERLKVVSKAVIVDGLFAALFAVLFIYNASIMDALSWSDFGIIFGIALAVFLMESLIAETPAITFCFVFSLILLSVATTAIKLIAMIPKESTDVITQGLTYIFGGIIICGLLYLFFVGSKAAIKEITKKIKWFMEPLMKKK